MSDPRALLDAVSGTFRAIRGYNGDDEAYLMGCSAIAELRGLYEGMPDFGPGDQIQKRNDPKVKGRVSFMGQDENGLWMIYCRSYGVDTASQWEKVPTEKTVTLRYAGPPDVIDKFLAAARPVPDGVRVERVEDDE